MGMGVCNRDRVKVQGQLQGSTTHVTRAYCMSRVLLSPPRKDFGRVWRPPRSVSGLLKTTEIPVTENLILNLHIYAIITLIL